MDKLANINKDDNIFNYYSVEDGDTLFKIADKLKIDTNLLAQLNGIKVDDYIYPNQILLIPKPGLILYITAVGDTLNEIIDGLNVTVDELIKQNNKLFLQPEQLIVYKY